MHNSALARLPSDPSTGAQVLSSTSRQLPCRPAAIRASSRLSHSPHSISGHSLSRLRRQAHLTSAASTATGGGGGFARPPNDRSTGGNDDDDQPGDGEAGSDPDGLLARAGVSASELPADLREALASGTLSAELLERWLWLSHLPLLGALGRAWPAFRDRVLGNPRFLLALAIEIAMGVGAKTTAEFRARGDNFWKEFNFVLSDLALELVGDVAIVWLLSPAAVWGSKPTGAMARFNASLPGYAFQVGDFPVSKRALNFVYRGLQFLLIGFGASVIGHGITKYAVEKQEAASGIRADKPLAPVLDNSLGWGSFMLISSNTRYQFVSAIEERMLDPFVASPALRTGLTFLLRFGNTFAGGEQWVRYAARIGLQ